MSKTKKPRGTGRKFTTAEARLVEAAAPDPGKPQARIVAAVGKLGDQPELRTISAIVAAAGLLTADRRLLRAGVRMLLAHELATLAKDIVKKRVNRTRPRNATTHRERKVKPGRSTAKEETSFPSGHSAGAFAVARAFARDYPEHQGAALVAAGLVAGAQVPWLAHYPTDVAAGIVLGVASEAVVGLILGPVEDGATPEAPPRPRPRA